MILKTQQKAQKNKQMSKKQNENREIALRGINRPSVLQPQESNTHVTEVQKKRGEKTQNIFQEVIAEKFPKFMQS